MARRSFVLGMTLMACAKQPGPAPAVPATTDAAPAPPACRTPRSDGRVLLADWPEPERARLAEQMKQGTVALRFDGCRAELVPECTATGAYAWVPFTPSAGEVTMLDAEELEIELPFRSKTLADEQSRYGELRFDYVLAGRWQSAVPNAIHTSGSCERATHVVTAIDVGSYALVAGPGLELTSAAQRRVIDRAGSPDACVSADLPQQPVSSCSALLRLELAPIAGVVGRDGCHLHTRWDGASCAAIEPQAWCAPRTYWNGAACSADADSEAAQSDYLEVDEHIRASELGMPVQTYSGTPVAVIERYRNEARVALELYRELDGVIRAHSSPEWRAIATVRQAILYYTLYLRLDASRAPHVALFTEEHEAMLAAADESDNPELVQKAASIRAKVSRAWRDAKRQELSGAAEVLVERFATAMFLANEKRAAHIASSAAVVALAEMTPHLGDATLERNTKRVSGVPYSSGVFVRMARVLHGSPAPAAQLNVPCPEGHSWFGVSCVKTERTSADSK
jgi:hypothetical protein